MMPKPRVLILSYFFPPLNGPGVQRALNFAKNLKNEGWNPVVLTVKPVEYVSCDESLLEELKDVEIIRSESLDPMRILHLYKKLRKNKIKDIYHDTPNETKQFWRDIFPIDSKILWLPFAYSLAKKICRLQKIDLIMATLSPYSSAILAYKLSKKTGIPYILDYRDLWKGKPDMTYFSSWHEKLAVLWEQKVTNAARKIVHVTKLEAEKFMKIFPECDKEKVSVIFNGYNQDKVSELCSDKSPGSNLSFTFAGHFYGGQTPEYLLKAIRLLESDDSLPDEVTFNFAGKYSPEIEEYFVGLKSVKRIPWLSYENYLKTLFNSNILMLFIAKENSKMILTQKIFDYFAMRKPIFAMIPSNGEAAELIQDYNAGLICEIDDVSSIKQNILKFTELHKKNQLDTRFPLHKNDYKIFQRKYQAKQLADLMREVINE